MQTSNCLFRQKDQDQYKKDKWLEKRRNVPSNWPRRKFLPIRNFVLKKMNLSLMLCNLKTKEGSLSGKVPDKWDEDQKMKRGHTL